MDYQDFNMNANDCNETCDDYMDSDFCEGDIQDNEPTRRRIEVDEVLGMGTAETSVEVCIPLNPPAFEIRDDLIKRTFEFDALVAHNNRVFVNGRVIKNIPYKTRISSSCPPCSGLTKITFGDIKHVTVEVPFNLCIDVPGAVKGAKVVVLDATVDSVEIPNFVKTPGITNTCPSNPCAPVKKNKIIKSITEKDCISVTVKVVRDTIICVNTGNY